MEGYFNATVLYKQKGKLQQNFTKWLNATSTQETIQNIADGLGLPVEQMVISKRGKGGGTWMHLSLKDVFGRWVDPKYQVAQAISTFNQGMGRLINGFDTAIAKRQLPAELRPSLEIAKKGDSASYAASLPEQIDPDCEILAEWYTAHPTELAEQFIQRFFVFWARSKETKYLAKHSEQIEGMREILDRMKVSIHSISDVKAEKMLSKALSREEMTLPAYCLPLSEWKKYNSSKSATQLAYKFVELWCEIGEIPAFAKAKTILDSALQKISENPSLEESVFRAFVSAAEDEMDAALSKR
jgi:KilA-N domain